MAATQTLKRKHRRTGRPGPRPRPARLRLTQHGPNAWTVWRVPLEGMTGESRAVATLLRQPNPMALALHEAGLGVTSFDWTWAVYNPDAQPGDRSRETFTSRKHALAWLRVRHHAREVAP